MIRKHYNIEEKQDEEIKRIAAKYEWSESKVLRRIIDRQLKLRNGGFLSPNN